MCKKQMRVLGEKMKLGVVGLPNVGKSTLFNAITKAGAQAANYPFCTIEPNVGVVAVPDERLENLPLFTTVRKSLPRLSNSWISRGLSKAQAKARDSATNFVAYKGSGRNSARCEMF